MSEQVKYMNEAPGFLCPECQNFRIKLSIEDFLTKREVICANCGTPFQMDKSQSTGLVQKLQELHIANKNVEMLKKQSL